MAVQGKTNSVYAKNVYGCLGLGCWNQTCGLRRKIAFLKTFLIGEF